MAVALQAALLVELCIHAVADQAAFAQVCRRGVDAVVGDVVAQLRQGHAHIDQRLVPRFDRGPISQKLREGDSLGGAAAQGHQITRRGAADADAAGDPLHVLHLTQGGTQVGQEPMVLDQPAHRTLPLFDFNPVTQRITQPVAQQSLAHGRGAASQHTEQAALDLSAAQRLIDLQAA